MAYTFSTDTIVANILADVTRQHGDRADVSEIAACHPSTLRAYRSGVRVRVTNEAHGYTRTGTVSRTTGWRPALLLIHRSNAMGSSDVLGPGDVVTHVKIGRNYTRTINAV